MQKLLVVEDGRAVQRALKRLFEPEGFAVEVTSDGASALAALKVSRPDLVLLDLRLPGIPGRDICKQIKKDWPDLPVIIVSAKTDVWDKVLLLEIGADDYVTKPFSPRELLARVRAALRRTLKTPAEERAAFGGVEVDFGKMLARKDGRAVTLTPQEFKLLKFLTRNSERVITREELLNEVWGYTNYPSTRTVDNHILKLRQKLEANAEEPRHFKTVHAVGYKFVP